MKLQSPKATYTREAMLELQRQIEGADQENMKRGRDIYLAPGRLILTAPDGSRYSLTVSNAGALAAVPI